MINQTNIKELFQQASGLAVINQYGEQNCVTLDKSVWKKKKNRTVSQWINQSEMKPFQRIGKRDKPVWLEEQEEEPCQRVRKRNKPVVKKICYIKVDCCSGEIVFRTMMYLLMKFRKSQTKLSRNSRKISLQFQRISNMESGICMIVKRREIIQEKRQNILQVAPNCAAFNGWLVLWLVLYATTKSG